MNTNSFLQVNTSLIPTEEELVKEIEYVKLLNQKNQNKPNTK